MSRLTRTHIRKLIYEELSKSRSLFLEGEDEGADIFGGDEEDAADEPADDEAEAEGGEAEGGDEASEDESEEGEGGDAEAEESPDEEEDSASATGPSDSGIDVEINAVMAEFEQEALDSAAAQNESKGLSLKIILEEEGDDTVPEIDIDSFAGNVARLISNYHNLIDMEMVIFNKAKSFLEDKYGKDTVDELETILASKYDIEIESTYDPEKEEADNYAAGAMNAQA